MTMMQPTRDKLLEISIRIMSVKGFNNTGIAEILAEADVPKGSFYHYFKSKDDLGFALIDLYGESLCSSLSSFLEKAKGKALTRLRNYFESLLDYFEQDLGMCNCLLGNLGQELSMQNEAMRSEINRHYEKVEKIIAECLNQAKSEGDLAPDTNTATLAKLFFSGWEGCLVRAKLEQSHAPLRSLLELFFNTIFTRGNVKTSGKKRGKVA